MNKIKDRVWIHDNTDMYLDTIQVEAKDLIALLDELEKTETLSETPIAPSETPVGHLAIGCACQSSFRRRCDGSLI